VLVDGHAAALVRDLDRAVLEHRHRDPLAEAGERLVDRVFFCRSPSWHDVQGWVWIVCEYKPGMRSATGSSPF
jgi:hypothetical protein